MADPEGAFIVREAVVEDAAGMAFVHVESWKQTCE